MAVSYMPLSPIFGAKRPGLFRRTTRDALADWLAGRYVGTGKRKRLMRDFGLSEDQARAALEGSASQSTLDAMWDRGGWELWLEVGALRFNEHVSQHLAREARRHADRAEKTAAMVRALRPRGAAGSDADPDGGAEHAGGMAAADRGTAQRSFRSRP